MSSGRNYKSVFASGLRACGVYFVRHDGRIKIGYSNDVRRRYVVLCGILPTLPEPLGFLPVPEGPSLRERELHLQFKHLRVRGEWFQDCAEIREFITREAGPWPKHDPT